MLPNLGLFSVNMGTSIYRDSSGASPKLGSILTDGEMKN